MTTIKKQLKQLFTDHFGREPAVLTRAPGRINLLGAHLDYNEGWVLPGAIEPAVWLAAAPTEDLTVTVQALNFQEQAVFRLPFLDVQASSVGGTWINYPVGVAWALQKAGYDLVGMDVLLVGDLPMESGLSSSAAVEVAFVLAWEVLAGFQLDDLDRARIGQRTENEYLGVGSGIMDQFACLHGRSHHLVYLDCRSLAYERVPLPPGLAVIIVDSGVHRRLTGVNYNKRSEECHQATAVLRRHLPHIQTLRDVSLDELEQCADHLPETLRKRALHVVGECARVQMGVTALRQGNAELFGRLVRQSHISSRDNYENSIPELDLLAETAWAIPGCYGARFAGGGFGGMMQVLADESAVPAITETIQETFARKYGRIPPVFSTSIADGAGIVR